MRTLLLVFCVRSAPPRRAGHRIVIQPEERGDHGAAAELPHAVAETRCAVTPGHDDAAGRSLAPAARKRWARRRRVCETAPCGAGRVDGTLLVINGDAILDSGAWSPRRDRVGGR